MKMKATIEAIYAMDDVEYDERVVKRQQRGYPNRYGKHGERCSTMKLVSFGEISGSSSSRAYTEFFSPFL
jgi:hypothetical protein